MSSRFPSPPAHGSLTQIRLPSPRTRSFSTVSPRSHRFARRSPSTASPNTPPAPGSAARPPTSRVTEVPAEDDSEPSIGRRSHGHAPPGQRRRPALGAAVRWHVQRLWMPLISSPDRPRAAATSRRAATSTTAQAEPLARSTWVLWGRTAWCRTSRRPLPIPGLDRRVGSCRRRPSSGSGSAIRNALDRPRCRQHRHPALPRIERPLGKRSANGHPTRRSLLTASHKQIGLAIYRLIPHTRCSAASDSVGTCA